MILALSVALQAGTPILAWGPPGVGKTAVITAMAESLSLPCEVVGGGHTRSYEAAPPAAGGRSYHRRLHAIP